MDKTPVKAVGLVETEPYAIRLADCFSAST